MITQAIKRWVAKMFGWWPWRNPQKDEYAPVSSHASKGMAQETATRSTIDAMTPYPGITPRITGVGQTGAGETNYAALDERQDQLVQPPPSAIHSAENSDALQHPISSLPTTPTTPTSLPAASRSGENRASISNNKETHAGTADADGADRKHLPSTPPISVRQLEFLQYLMQHGLLNEGFEKDQVPDQYRTHE
jgi:hypothetical protein